MSHPIRKVNLTEMFGRFQDQWSLLFEPNSTLNTENVRNERTVAKLDRL